VSVSPSTDGGKTFAAPVTVVSENLTLHIIDKDWMTVDLKDPSHIVITYSDFDLKQLGCAASNAMTSIRLVSSTNGGAMFSAQVVVGTSGVCNDVL
jgi:hypothetical protein